MQKEKAYSGFTLIEILTVLVILGVILGSLLKIFDCQAEAYKAQARVVERQQELRAALEIIARDCRSAGYLSPDSSFLSRLPDWIPDSFIPKSPQTVHLDGVLTVTPGGGNPDLLSLLSLLSSQTNPTSLAQGAQAGDTIIFLALNGSESDDQYNPGDVLYIGKPPEWAQVKAVSGQMLTIDTDPLQPGDQGLKKAHPAGTETGEISLVSYAVFNDANDPEGKYHSPGTPVLKRKINGGGFEPLSEHISDLKMSRVKPNLFSLSLSVEQALIGSAPLQNQGNSLTLQTQILKRN
jgi:prepilin-type N-terminal cleavage/methylation domain-containing protein